MRYYLDTEFSERGRGRPIELISIALVREDGAELYAVSNEFDPASCSYWVKEHVLPQLPPADHEDVAESGRYTWTSNDVIAKRICRFIGLDQKPEFWAYYAAYDWVLFCQLFGTMQDMPDHLPQICYDLQQYAEDIGVRDPLKALVPMTAGEHDALCDARWNREVHEYLRFLDDRRKQ